MITDAKIDEYIMKFNCRSGGSAHRTVSASCERNEPAFFCNFLRDAVLLFQSHIDGLSMKDFSIKKLYYSISEVSKITDLEQYVLRYWESEFEELKPAKNRAGNRIYTNRDIQLILYIKKLLREERYTIEGAKHVLKSYTPSEVQEPMKLDLPTEPMQKTAQTAMNFSSDVKLQDDIREVKQFLEDLLVRVKA